MCPSLISSCIQSTTSLRRTAKHFLQIVDWSGIYLPVPIIFQNILRVGLFNFHNWLSEVKIARYKSSFDYRMVLLYIFHFFFCCYTTKVFCCTIEYHLFQHDVYITNKAVNRICKNKIHIKILVLVIRYGYVTNFQKIFFVVIVLLSLRGPILLQF